MASQTQLVENKANQLPQYVAAISVCMGSVAAGTVLGWTSNIGVMLEDGNLNDITADSDARGWIGSMATLGALVMCVFTGILCNLLGRKWTMLMLIAPFTLGWLLIILANSLEMLYAGRFFTGLASGAFCISAPLYTSEISEKEIRGRLGSFFQLFLTVGILLAYVFPLIDETILLHSILCGIFPLIFGVVFFLQPETPVHLLKKGKVEEARKSLQKFRGKHYDTTAELKQIESAIEEERRMNVPFFTAIKSPAAVKAALICFALMFFQQFSGINAVIFYTGNIFRMANIDLPEKYATIIIGGAQVIATAMSSFLIEKLGRKILLIFSALAMALSTILLGVYFTLNYQAKEDPEMDISDIGFLPVLALCIFIVAFSLGFGPIPWLISSELFPQEIKAVASSAAGSFNWLLAFIITRFYENIAEDYGDVTFYVFSGCSIVGAVFIFFVIPETKGKSFDEIQEILGGKKVDRSNETRTS